MSCIRYWSTRKSSRSVPQNRTVCKVTGVVHCNMYRKQRPPRRRRFSRRRSARLKFPLRRCALPRHCRYTLAGAVGPQTLAGACLRIEQQLEPLLTLPADSEPQFMLARGQEEDEAAYQAAFPDHFGAFEDVATLEDEPGAPPDDENAARQPLPSVASEAEASSSAAAQLLRGATLQGLVRLHARWVRGDSGASNFVSIYFAASASLAHGGISTIMHGCGTKLVAVDSCSAWRVHNHIQLTCVLSSSSGCSSHRGRRTQRSAPPASRAPTTWAPRCRPVVEALCGRGLLGSICFHSVHRPCCHFVLLRGIQMLSVHEMSPSCHLSWRCCERCQFLHKLRMALSASVHTPDTAGIVSRQQGSPRPQQEPWSGVSPGMWQQSRSCALDLPSRYLGVVRRQKEPPEVCPMHVGA